MMFPLVHGVISTRPPVGGSYPVVPVSWSEVSTPVVLGGGSQIREHFFIVGMDADKFAYWDHLTDEIQMFQVSGGSVSSLGSPISTPDSYYKSSNAVYLGNNKLVRHNTVQHLLETYRWNPATETWSLVTSGSISSSVNPSANAMLMLTEERLIFWDDSTNFIRLFESSGETAWSSIAALNTGAPQFGNASDMPGSMHRLSDDKFIAWGGSLIHVFDVSSGSIVLETTITTSPTYPGSTTTLPWNGYNGQPFATINPESFICLMQQGNNPDVGGVRHLTTLSVVNIDPDTYEVTLNDQEGTVQPSPVMFVSSDNSQPSGVTKLPGSNMVVCLLEDDDRLRVFEYSE